MKRLLYITLLGLLLGCLLAACDDASNPDALLQSTPQPPSTPRPTPTHDPSVIPPYDEVQALLVGGDIEAHTLVGTRLENWHGWVVWKMGTSVYVHVEDPFTEELLPDLTWDEWNSCNPSPTAATIKKKLDERDSKLTLDLDLVTMERADGLAYGQEIRFNARVKKVQPAAELGDRMSITLEDLEVQPVDGVPGSPTVDESTEVNIRLEKSICYGFCPDYTLVIKGDGLVTYEGREYVKVCGTQRDQISRESVLELVNLFRKADFFTLRNYTTPHWNHGSSHTLSFTLGGRTHSVSHDTGDVTTPTRLEILEGLVDEITDSERWVGDDTMYYSSCDVTPTPALSP